MDSILDPKNKVKPDWSKMPPVRKTCAACQKEFSTTERWKKRCNHCRDTNQRYKKVIVNKNINPF